MKESISNLDARESRVKKSLTNAKVNLVFYFLVLVLAFFSRRIFLENLTVDFIGFTGTLQNLLGFLNLAELGIASAIGYVLYQPIYNGDKDKIIEIISVFGYLYQRVGYIILFAGLVLACFLPFIFHDTTIDTYIIFIAFFSYLISSLISYFANYKQTLLAADQKNYIVTAYFQTASILKICIQMAVAYYMQSWFWWLFINLLFAVLHSVILNWKINKVYPWLKSDKKQGGKLLHKYSEIKTYTKQLFLHKIAGFIQFQTNPFIIYAYTSLAMVAAYGNYMMIINNLLNFVNKFLGSTEAAIGNLVASNDTGKIIKVFRELTSLRYFIAGLEVFGIFTFSGAFITVWVGGEFVLSHSTLILLLIYIFLMQTRGTNDQFIYAYGLFSDVWAAIAEMAISLGGALCLGYVFGLPGVISGGVIGMLIIVYLWKPYYLCHNGLKISIWHYWRVVGKLLALIAISIVLSYFIYSKMFGDEPTNFIILFVQALILAVVYSIISFALFYIFDSGTRDFVKRFWFQIVKNKRKVKCNEYA